MAVGTKLSSNAAAVHSSQDVFFATSASGMAQTVSTDTIGVRRLVQVTIKYSAAQTATATVTLNAAAGSGYDTLIQNIAFSGQTDGVFIPDEELRLQDGDAIDVVAPALASQTSAVQIYVEHL